MALSLLLQLSLQRLLFLFDLPEPSLMGCNLLLKIFWKASAVYTDTDWNLMVAAGFYHCAGIFF